MIIFQQWPRHWEQQVKNYQLIPLPNSLCEVLLLWMLSTKDSSYTAKQQWT